MRRKRRARWLEKKQEAKKTVERQSKKIILKKRNFGAELWSLRYEPSGVMDLRNEKMRA